MLRRNVWSNKKAPQTGEVAGLFGIHKIFATDLKFRAAAFLRTLTAAYSNIIAQLLKLVNTFYATFCNLTTRLRSLNAFSSGPYKR